MFINKKYCNLSQDRNRLCTKDVKLLAVNLRPYYLPVPSHKPGLYFYVLHCTLCWHRGGRQNHTTGGTDRDKIPWCPLPHPLIRGRVAGAAAQASPDAVKFIQGDFNLYSLTELLPTYHQYVSCPTRNQACLDLCYGSIEKAYYAKTLPGLGK